MSPRECRIEIYKGEPFDFRSARAIHKAIAELIWDTAETNGFVKAD